MKHVLEKHVMEKSWRHWLQRMTARRVPLAIGIYGAACLMILEVCRTLAASSAGTVAWLDLLALGLLCGVPVVAALVFLRPKD